MLWAGTVMLRPPPVTATSPSRVIALAEVSCQACAALPAAKLLSVMENGAATPTCLLMTMTVRAPSEERTAANDETRSGFGTASETLTSPKPDFCPS